MDKITKKEKRYIRLYEQIKKLMSQTTDLISKMATINAVLDNKVSYFFWTGFYFVKNDKLVVGPYQGSLACLVLPKDTGVCWQAVRKNNTVIVEDVKAIKDHIACDGRSNSEIVVPIHNKNGKVIAVMDVDSDKTNSFDDIDKKYLEKFVKDFLENR